MDIYEEWDVKYKLTLNAEEMKALKDLVEGGHAFMMEKEAHNRPLGEHIKIASKLSHLEVRTIPVKPTKEL
jgi:hypothetical protein